MRFPAPEWPQGRRQGQRTECSEGLDTSMGTFTASRRVPHTRPARPRCRSQSRIQHQVCPSVHVQHSAPPRPPGTSHCTGPPSMPHLHHLQGPTPPDPIDRFGRTTGSLMGWPVMFWGDGPTRSRPTRREGDKHLETSWLPVDCAGDRGIPTGFHRKPAVNRS